MVKCGATIPPRPLRTYANLPEVIGPSSKLLIAHQQEILTIWRARCLKEVASAGTVVTLALTDSLPSYLDGLADALATNRKMDYKSIAERDRVASYAGKRHGAERAGDKSYALSEVISEYHILREVIFSILETEGPLPAIQRDIILNSIEQAVNNAAVEFSEVHTDVQQKFLNTLTHDLKTPITSAMVHAQMISRYFDQPDFCLKSSLKIVGSLKRLTGMIHDLLDASRLRAGEALPLQLESIDLSAITREVLSEMAAVYGERFCLNCPEVVVGVYGGAQLMRALENLIGNAVKYSTPNTPITVTLTATSTWVKWEVHNEGPEIPADELPMLFQDFRRAKSAHEGSATGWGLGLTLVKGVADAHGGRIHAVSSKDEGTRFILEIPTTANPHKQ